MASAGGYLIRSEVLKVIISDPFSFNIWHWVTVKNWVPMTLKLAYSRTDWTAVIFFPKIVMFGPNF